MNPRKSVFFLSNDAALCLSISPTFVLSPGYDKIVLFSVF